MYVQAVDRVIVLVTLSHSVPNFISLYTYCMLIVYVVIVSAVDIWSVGCIMGEMIRGSVMFPGTDRILDSL